MTFKRLIKSLGKNINIVLTFINIVLLVVILVKISKHNEGYNIPCTVKGKYCADGVKCCKGLKCGDTHTCVPDVQNTCTYSVQQKCFNLCTPGTKKCDSKIHNCLQANGCPAP